MGPSRGRVALGVTSVAADFVEGRVPRGELHDHVGQPLARCLVRHESIELAGLRQRDCGRYGEGDPATGARLERTAHQLFRLVHRSERSGGVGGKGDAGTVDAVEKVESHVALTGDGQRLVQQTMGTSKIAACCGQLGEALQRECLTGRSTHVVVHFASAPQVAVGVVETTGQELGFAAQRRGERMAASRTEPLGLLGECIGPADHVLIRP